MKKIVVGDVEAIRTCVRRRRNEDKVTELTNRNGVAEAGGGGVGVVWGAGGRGGLRVDMSAIHCKTCQNIK